MFINISFDWNLPKERANLRTVRNIVALITVTNISPLSSLLLLYINTNWNWSQASPLMTRGDKRQGENGRPSCLLRKLDSVRLSISRGWQNAGKAQIMLGLNLREIESLSTGSKEYTDNGDKVAKGAKQSEQALHRVPVLNYPGRGCWEAISTRQHTCTLDWNSAWALSPPLVASHMSPVSYDSMCCPDFLGSAWEGL